MRESQLLYRRSEVLGKKSKPVSHHPEPIKVLDRIMFIQKTAGNQAVKNIIKNLNLQAKLSIGKSGDEYEQEADRVADKVTMMHDLQPVLMNDHNIQRNCLECEGNELQRQPLEEDEEKLQRQQIEEDEEKKLRRQPEDEEEDKIQARGEDSVPAVNPDIEDKIRSLEGKGQPLSKKEREFFEPRFGYDFSTVRLHTDVQSEMAAKSVNALAFTMGNNIVFSAGQYAPETPAGKKLLAHELTHVIQQDTNQVHRLVSDNRVSCRNLPRSYPIFTAMRTNDPVGEIRTADTRAIEILDNVINELTNIRQRVIAGETPAYPLIADAVGLGLRNRLRLNASDRAVWTGTGPGTVEIIIRWYTNVRSLLTSGIIRYTCIGNLCISGRWAYVFEGTRRIHLCRNFWNASNDNRALTLIHETAHLYYGLEDAGGGAGNASCLEQYAADANGIDVLPEFIGICRPPPP